MKETKNVVNKVDTYLSTVPTLSCITQSSLSYSAFSRLRTTTRITNLEYLPI